METTFQRLLTGETDVCGVGCTYGWRLLTEETDAGGAECTSECWRRQTVTREFVVVRLLTEETSAGGFSGRESGLEWIEWNRSAANVNRH